MWQKSKIIFYNLTFCRLNLKLKIITGVSREKPYHPFWAQSALHQVTDGDGTNKGRLKMNQTNSWLKDQLLIFKPKHKSKLTSRAVSALSSSAPCLKMLTGAIDKDACTHTNRPISSHWCQDKQFCDTLKEKRFSGFKCSFSLLLLVRFFFQSKALVNFPHMICGD